MCMYERWRKSYKSSAEILHKQRQKTHTHLVLAKFYPAYELAHRNVAKTKSQRVKDLIQEMKMKDVVLVVIKRELISNDVILRFKPCH